MTTQDELRGRLPLAPHMFQILLSLLEKDLHGYALLKDISERTNGEMALGTSTLYAALQRMVKDGYLEETNPAHADEAQGPPRKYFQITQRGRRLAREEALRIRRLNQMVEGSALLDALDPVGAGEEGA